MRRSLRWQLQAASAVEDVRDSLSIANFRFCVPNQHLDLGRSFWLDRPGAHSQRGRFFGTYSQPHVSPRNRADEVVGDVCWNNLIAPLAEVRSKHPAMPPSSTNIRNCTIGMAMRCAGHRLESFKLNHKNQFQRQTQPVVDIHGRTSFTCSTIAIKVSWMSCALLCAKGHPLKRFTSQKIQNPAPEPGDRPSKPLGIHQTAGPRARRVTGLPVTRTCPERGDSSTKRDVQEHAVPCKISAVTEGTSDARKVFFQSFYTARSCRTKQTLALKKE